jgi:hypothetical protein
MYIVHPVTNIVYLLNFRGFCNKEGRTFQEARGVDKSKIINQNRSEQQVWDCIGRRLETLDLKEELPKLQETVNSFLNQYPTVGAR